MEGLDGVAGRARRTAEVAGDAFGVLALGAGEEDLAATQGEGVVAAEADAQWLTLGVREGTEKEGWMHTPIIRARALTDKISICLAIVNLHQFLKDESDKIIKGSPNISV